MVESLFIVEFYYTTDSLKASTFRFLCFSISFFNKKRHHHSFTLSSNFFSGNAFLKNLWNLVIPYRMLSY